MTLKEMLAAKRAELAALDKSAPASLKAAKAIKAEIADLEGKVAAAKVPASRRVTSKGGAPKGGTEAGAGGSTGAITSFAVKAGAGGKMAVLKAGAGITPDEAIKLLSAQGHEFVEAAKAAHGGGRQPVASLQIWDPTKTTPVLSKDNSFNPTLIKALGCDFTLREEPCPVDQGGRPVSSSLPQVPAPFGKFRVRGLPDASAAVDGVTVDWRYHEVDYCGNEVNPRSGTKAHVILDPDCGDDVEWYLRAHSISLQVDNCSRFFDDVFVNEAIRIANVALDETLERSRLEELHAAALAAGQSFSFTGPFGSSLTAYEGIKRVLQQLARRNRGDLTQQFSVVIDTELATAFDIDANNVGFCCDKGNPFDGFRVVVTPDVRSGDTAPAYLGVADTLVALDRDPQVSPIYFIPSSAFIATGPSINYGFDSILDLDIIRENQSVMFTEEHSTMVLPCAPAYAEITHCPSGARSALADGACESGE